MFISGRFRSTFQNLIMFSPVKKIFSIQPIVSLIRWFDTEAGVESLPDDDQKKVDWFRILPLVFMHVMCLGVIWVGWSWTAVLVAAGLYVVRMFAITAFYHRYFSHKAFKTNRFSSAYHRQHQHRPYRPSQVGQRGSHRQADV